MMEQRRNSGINLQQGTQPCRGEWGGSGTRGLDEGPALQGLHYEVLLGGQGFVPVGGAGLWAALVQVTVQPQPEFATGKAREKRGLKWYSRCAIGQRSLIKVTGMLLKNLWKKRTILQKLVYPTLAARILKKV